ncbi:hypothetical protein FOA52_013506 [Chlamydomonas sp. UWO 241]|nr:hypothetical protein FOA52_013506 [Chlamydomonas sp. UWO 241]
MRRRSFVLSIPVARGANWFLAGGGRRMDEEEATAAAAERIAAAAEDGTSLPVRLATDVVRFLYGGTGRREPADGGVVSASLLNAKPAVGGIGVEPRGGGVLRVLFTVASDAVADTVVRWRHELRRCVDSTAVFDVLSDREEAQHQALWPAFLAAKVAGKRAQFHRARLVVDGERVPAPALGVFLKGRWRHTRAVAAPAPRTSTPAARPLPLRSVLSTGGPVAAPAARQGGRGAQTLGAVYSPSQSTEQNAALMWSPNITHGAASVRGLTKPDNQDRLVVMASRDSACHSLSWDDGPAALVAALRDDFCPPVDAEVTLSAVFDGHGGSNAATIACVTQYDFCPPVDVDVTLSAVFDGHGGSNAATIAARRLHDVVATDDRLWRALESCSSSAATHGVWDADLDEQVQQRWHSVFARLDDEIISHSREVGKVDGTTVLAGIHSGLFLFIANAGDSRAVLARGGAALRLTRDHTPELQTERARIEEVGGLVRHMKGCWRVLLPNQALTQAKICSTSRGLGDADFKMKRLLTCEPEVTSLQLVPHLDEFSIFATDGVWRFVEDQDAVAAVAAALASARASGLARKETLPQVAAAAVVRLALERGSFDDISAVVHVYDWLGGGADDGAWDVRNSAAAAASGGVVCRAAVPVLGRVSGTAALPAGYASPMGARWSAAPVPVRGKASEGGGEPAAVSRR